MWIVGKCRVSGEYLRKESVHMGILDELIPELVRSRHGVESDIYDD